MQPASPRFVMTLVVALAVVSVAPRAFADPQGPQVEPVSDPRRSEGAQVDHSHVEHVYVEQLVAPPIQDDPPARLEELPARPSSRGQTTVMIGFWGAGHDVGELVWRYRGADVAALDGHRVPQGVFPRRARQVGFLYGAGYKPLPWLRLPEVRLGLGGGGYYTGTTHDVGDRGLEVTAARTFLFRLEVLAGVEIDLGVVTPFVRGYVAGSVRTLRTRVSHGDLGALGTERITKLDGDLGVEAGFAMHFRPNAQSAASGSQQSPRIGFTLAYRRGLLGSDAHGAILALSLING
ncbi:MAG: hypothetical protein KF901_18170 [Myxococcales bacterium]|nr:hypothetical protein [Myxococcales bacterium]